jgi:rSAM/selenodomain-associated transferase 2
MALTISVIVPVRADAAALERVLAQLAAADDALEIIVVEAGGDACAALCRDHGARHLVAEPCRGGQLAAGASAATGDVLWFVHADATLPPTAIAAIRAAVAGGAAGGYFRFRFQGLRTAWKRMLEPLIALRARFGVPYGDQALFATRQAYAAAGGFPPVPLFEEVPFVRGMRRAGRFVALAEPVGVSPRRWESDGWMRRTIENRALALRHALGVSPWDLAARYQRVKHERTRRYAD